MIEEELITNLNARGEKVPRRFIRAGLVYDYDPDLDTYHYMPADTFEVDGIVYPIDARSPGEAVTVLTDNQSSAWSVMHVSAPPTDEELDQWCRNGYTWQAPHPIYY